MIYILIITQPPMAGTRNNGVSACLNFRRRRRSRRDGAEGHLCHPAWSALCTLVRGKALSYISFILTLRAQFWDMHWYLNIMY